MALGIIWIVTLLWLFGEFIFGVATIEEKHDEEKDLTNLPK